MSERAFSVAEQGLQLRARKRSRAWAIMPVAALLLIDLAISVAAFVISYKLHHDTPLFVWRYRRTAWPIGIWDAFEPYLTLMLFVPFVKVYALRRYGLYKLRGEF